MPSVFITRELKNDSPFRNRLETAGWIVKGWSLVDFTLIPFDELPDAEWIFFYSSRGVRHFFEGMSRLNRPVPANARLAVLGPGTAAELATWGGQPDFTGTGEPLATAAAFLSRARGCRVLFPRARKSRSSIRDLLGTAIVAVDLIVYDNEPTGEAPLDPFDVLVFTSPLNAEAFCRQRPFRRGQHIVAIGHTTGETLRNLGADQISVSEEASEEAMGEKVLEIAAGR